MALPQSPFQPRPNLPPEVLRFFNREQAERQAMNMGMQQLFDQMKMGNIGQLGQMAGGISQVPGAANKMMADRAAPPSLVRPGPDIGLDRAGQPPVPPAPGMNLWQKGGAALGAAASGAGAVQSFREGDRPGAALSSLSALSQGSKLLPASATTSFLGQLAGPAALGGVALQGSRQAKSIGKAGDRLDQARGPRARAEARELRGELGQQGANQTTMGAGQGGAAGMVLGAPAGPIGMGVGAILGAIVGGGLPGMATQEQVGTADLARGIGRSAGNLTVAGTLAGLALGPLGVLPGLVGGAAKDVVSGGAKGVRKVASKAGKSIKKRIKKVF